MFNFGSFDIKSIFAIAGLILVAMGILSMFFKPVRQKCLGLLRTLYGDFSRAELIKFILLGIIFSFVIGVYWTMRPLKDSVFMSMVGAQYIAFAKILSLTLLFPLVVLYSKMVDRFPRQKMFYALTSFYIVATALFGLLLMHPTLGLANTTVSTTRWVGWIWYVFVESYGSLLVALFWAFAADITTPDSAKRGFYLVTMVGQLGSFTFPYFFAPLATRIGSAPIVLVSAGLMIFIILLVYIFMRVTPKSELRGYKGKNEEKIEKEEKIDEPGFLDGLRLLLTHKYLLGIFGIVFFYEIIVTIIDYHFKNLVALTQAGVDARTLYLGQYAVYVNLVAFFCLLFGISNIQRRLGLRFSLAMMPFIVGAAVLVFRFNPVVSVLFWIMVGAKAVNYALNGPSVKQLYVPTTNAVKYKSQAWIDTFGSRSSKGLGSGFNALKPWMTSWWGESAGMLFHIALSTYLSVGLLAGWLIAALYLGKTYQQAVDRDEVVC